METKDCKDGKVMMLLKTRILKKRLNLMKQPMLLSMISIISVGLLCACSKSIEGNGQLSTQSRAIGQFDQIEISGDYQVQITSSATTPTVSVQADSNLQQAIVTEVSSGVLKVYTKDQAKLHSAHDRVITIFIPSLKSLSSSGRSQIEATVPNCQSLLINSTDETQLSLAAANCQELTLDLSGDSEVELQGDSLALDLTTLGYSLVEGVKMRVQHATIELGDKSKVSITVLGSLSVKSSDSSILEYYGHPKLTQLNVSGASQVRARE